MFPGLRGVGLLALLYFAAVPTPTLPGAVSPIPLTWEAAELHQQSLTPCYSPLFPVIDRPSWHGSGTPGWS